MPNFEVGAKKRKRDDDDPPILCSVNGCLFRRGVVHVADVLCWNALSTVARLYHSDPSVLRSDICVAVRWLSIAFVRRLLVRCRLLDRLLGSVLPFPCS